MYRLLAASELLVDGYFVANLGGLGTVQDIITYTKLHLAKIDDSIGTPYQQVYLRTGMFVDLLGTPRKLDYHR